MKVIKWVYALFWGSIVANFVELCVIFWMAVPSLDESWTVSILDCFRNKKEKQVKIVAFVYRKFISVPQKDSEVTV